SSLHRRVPLDAAQRRGLLRERPGGEPQSPEAADAAPQVDPDDQPGGAGLRGRAAEIEGDPQVADREGVSEAGVRDLVAGERAVAEGEVHGDRTQATGGLHPRASGDGKERARQVRRSVSPATSFYRQFWT